MDKKAYVAISGGFDPLHIGHVRMIKEAAMYGNVIVILNSDAWLMRKKGYVFMPWEQRTEIIAAIVGVKSVVAVDDSDGTVLEALKRIKPDYFANGGDRTFENTPEITYCLDNDIRLLWGVGGEKVANSSELVNAVVEIAEESVRNSIECAIREDNYNV